MVFFLLLLFFGSSDFLVWVAFFSKEVVWFGAFFQFFVWLGFFVVVVLVLFLFVFSPKQEIIKHLHHKPH